MVSKFGISLLVFVLALAGFADAQAKRNSRQTKSPESAATPEPTPDKSKKNERPVVIGETKPAATTVKEPIYRYEFTQPEFLINRIVIEHDDTGRGSISFGKKSYSESITEPIEISPATLERLKATFTALNFIDSTENYQFERDFAHMGNIAITLKTAGRERTAKYNWTSNVNAKALMDEYRRIANQFVWMFDFNLARENQPLETPKLVDAFDSLLKRNEIADPHQMLPFLQTVSNDERVPLIGRNHAGKLVKQIEKQKKSN
jgi:hypothetical protein